MTQNNDKHKGGGHRRKWQEMALIVPVLALFLLTPPFISIFTIEISFFGIPLIVLYIFVVWISLVLITRFLSARLMMGNLGDQDDSMVDTTDNGDTR